MQPFKLDDGAELYLTTAIDADRSGKAYPDGFTPDQVISFNGGSMPQESNDQVVTGGTNVAGGKHHHGSTAAAGNTQDQDAA